MTWPKVIIFAVASAVFTAGMLLIPALSSTSLHNIGVCFEAWVLFAMIIILNCEKPLEAAIKTFVFFLISQPLIYLIQVPFSEMGFGIFIYYKYWLIWTVLTFPAAFLVWFLKKHSWASAAVLTVVNAMLLGLEFPKHLEMMIKEFPYQIFACVFILAQVVVYIFVCLKDKAKRLAAGTAALVILVLFMLFNTNLLIVNGVTSSVSLSGNGPFTIVSCDDGLKAEISENTVNFGISEYGVYELEVSDADGNLKKVRLTYDDFGLTIE